MRSRLLTLGRSLAPAISCALLLLARPAFAEETPAYQNTVEWGRLVRLWHELLDHSSGQTYRPERFGETAPDRESIDADLASLVSQKLLPADVGEGLRRVFHARYQYVKERCYPTSARTQETSTEALRGASSWVVEMQLSLLRQQSWSGRLDPKLSKAIQTNLTNELSFQFRLADLESELTRRREELAKQEQADWDKFNRAAAKQYAELAQAYQNRRLPRDRAVSRLVPYLVALTQATPSEKAGATSLSNL